MSNNIVSLQAGNAVINDKLVQRLEELLVQAKKGDIMGIAYASVRRDHARLTAWLNPPVGYGHDQAAAVMELNHRYAQMLCDGAEEPDL